MVSSPGRILIVSTNQPNPYAAPLTEVADQPELNIDPVVLKKVQAIIKDANQFWLAMLLCLFCGVAPIIIGPWYLVRLVQWSSVARTQPMLLAAHAPPGSLARQFRSAKTKLMIGVCFGAVMFLLVLLYFTTLFGKNVALNG